MEVASVDACAYLADYTVAVLLTGVALLCFCLLKAVIQLMAQPVHIRVALRDIKEHCSFRGGQTVEGVVTGSLTGSRI